MKILLMKRYKVIWRKSYDSTNETKVKAPNCYQAKSKAVKNLGINPMSVVRVVEMN